MGECSPLDALTDVFGRLPDIIFAFSLDERYLYANPAAAEFLSADPVEVIGRHWRDLGYPAAVMEPIMQTMREVGSAREPSRMRVQTSERVGSRVLDLSLVPLVCESDEVFGVLVLAHDVSEFF